jgi:hypothetical protein
VSNHRSEALRQSARDEACAACGVEDGTIVWCHSNEYRHGKGKGLKAHDLFGFYGCMYCHARYDAGHETREDKHTFFREAWERSMIRVAEKLARGELKL